MNTNNADKSPGGIDLSSKFWRASLVLVAVLQIFVGSTYVPYVLVDLLKVDYFVSIALGTLSLVAGIALIWFLIRKKVIE